MHTGAHRCAAVCTNAHQYAHLHILHICALMCADVHRVCTSVRSPTSLAKKMVGGTCCHAAVAKNPKKTIRERLLRDKQGVPSTDLLLTFCFRFRSPTPPPLATDGHHEPSPSVPGHHQPHSRAQPRPQPPTSPPSSPSRHITSTWTISASVIVLDLACGALVALTYVFFFVFTSFSRLLPSTAFGRNPMEARSISTNPTRTRAIPPGSCHASDPLPFPGRVGADGQHEVLYFTL